MLTQTEDTEILSLFGVEQTKNKAFNLLLKKYQQKITGMCAAWLLTMMTQMTWCRTFYIKVWKNPGEFRSDAALYTWLYRIATNECLTYLNKRKLRNNISLDDVDTGLTDRLTAPEYFDGDKAALKLQQAILTLPDKQRLVFNMKYYDELKYDEMSGIRNKRWRIKSIFSFSCQKDRKFPFAK